MSKREITRNGRVYLFDGNKYAGSRSATANDIPTAGALRDAQAETARAAQELMDPRTDYSRTAYLMKAQQEKQEAEDLLNEAEKYGIDLDLADIPAGTVASAYIRSNHRLVKTNQQMQTVL